jgi:hypothetical protein
MKFLKLVMIFSSLFFSASAFAIIDGQLLVGKGSTEAKATSGSESISSTDVKIAGHVDPIPLVPVAFGLYGLKQEFDSNKSGSHFGFKSFSGMQIGLEVMAWFPLDIKEITPYAKLGYSIYGPYTYKMDQASRSVEIDYSQKGLHLTAGLRWSPLVLISGLLEFDYAKTTLTPDTAKIDGQKDDINNYKSVDLTAMTILIGAQVGF